MDSDGNGIKKKRLGEVLCEKAYLDAAGLGVALAEQKVKHRRLGQILLDLGYITPAQLNEALAAQVGIAKVDPSGLSIQGEIISLVPADLVRKYNILPLWRENGRLAVAMTDPFQLQAVEDLRLVAGCFIQRYYAEPAQLENAVLRFYGSNVARMLDDPRLVLDRDFYPLTGPSLSRFLNRRGASSSPCCSCPRTDANRTRWSGCGPVSRVAISAIELTVTTTVYSTYAARPGTKSPPTNSARFATRSEYRARTNHNLYQIPLSKGCSQPLLGAFLIPPAWPVVLPIDIYKWAATSSASKYRPS
jgi:hypothetical protein